MLDRILNTHLAKVELINIDKQRQVYVNKVLEAWRSLALIYMA